MSRHLEIPLCDERGMDLDLRVRPVPPPAASRNPGYADTVQYRTASHSHSPAAAAGCGRLGDLAPLGLRSKNKGFERPGLYQVNSFREQSQIGFVVNNFSEIYLRSIFPYM